MSELQSFILFTTLSLSCAMLSGVSAVTSRISFYSSSQYISHVSKCPPELLTVRLTVVDLKPVFSKLRIVLVVLVCQFVTVSYDEEKTGKFWHTTS